MGEGMSGNGLIVGIGGTPRQGSSTELLLRHVLSAAEARGFETRAFGGADILALPMYVPGEGRRDGIAQSLVAALADCSAVVLASPAYHGGISGLVKNAIDYTEDLSKAPDPYFSGRPVACLSTGAGWQGVIATLASLRTVVHALRGWPTPFGLGINSAEFKVPGLDEPLDAGLASRVGIVADELTGFVARHEAHAVAAPIKA
jgi:FMN reductase